MAALVLLTFSLALVAPPTNDRSAPIAGTVRPAVWSDLEGDASSPAVWVFLADRGPVDIASELKRLETTFSPRALERRRLRRTAPGTLDQRDLPLWAGYERTIAATGATIRVRSRWLNAISVQASGPQIERLSRLPFVVRIEPVARTTSVAARMPTTESHECVETEASAPAGAFYGLAQGQIEQINLAALHDDGYRGQGVLIGVLDTGFNRTHDAFNQIGAAINIVAEYDFVDDDANTAFEVEDLVAQHDHGTLILGVLAANQPGVVVGGAYEASFLLAKVESIAFENTSEEDWFVAGLEWLEANGADIATSSLVIFNTYTQEQLDGMTSVMSQGVKIAVENGMHFFQAAGNNGHDTNPATSQLIAPADGIDANSVAALTPFDNVAAFSSDGPTADGRVKPEIAARGQDTWTPDSFNDSLVVPVSGTSLAAPLACSAAACIVQKHPDWTPRQLRSALYQTASYYVANGTHDPQYVQGYGIVDAHAASLANPKQADLNQDFIVGVDDFLYVLLNWGPCASCPEDLNRDGQIGIDEFLQVLSEWD